MSILKGSDGSYSSKRAMGILYLLGGLFIVIFKELNDKLINNPEIIAGIFITGGGLLGLGVLEYFNKFKK